MKHRREASIRRVFKNVKIVIGAMVSGEALVADVPLSFLGDVDYTTGTIKSPESKIRGCSLTGKVLVVEKTRGSTVGSYVIYALKRHGRAPAAIVLGIPDPVVIAGCVMADVPLAMASSEFFNFVETGDIVEINVDEGVIVVEKKRTTSSI